MILRKSVRFAATSVENLAPTAPSMTRWSYDRLSGTIKRGSNSLPFHLGFISDLDTPNMATSGAFTIGVNAVPPIPPRLEMVNSRRGEKTKLALEHVGG